MQRGGCRGRGEGAEGAARRGSTASSSGRWGMEVGGGDALRGGGVRGERGGGRGGSKEDDTANSSGGGHVEAQRRMQWGGVEGGEGKVEERGERGQQGGAVQQIWEVGVKKGEHGDRLGGYGREHQAEKGSDAAPVGRGGTKP